MSLPIQTRFDLKNRWILVPVALHELNFDFVLDTGTFVSRLSQETFAVLSERGYIEAVGPRLHVLRDVTMDGHAVPDLYVQVSERVSQVSAEGLVGLAFLGHFRTVLFDTESRLLTLTSTES